MKQWSDTAQINGVCTWKQDRRDAMRVAAHLGISLITLDFEKEYKEWVMGYMFSEYEAGRTPNPDVMCNKFIKFGAWLKKAQELGFDYLATGHYARVIKTQEHENMKTLCLLGRAKDDNKDQTYFLHQLTQEQLQHVLFPIGEYPKQQVRDMAREFELPTAEREESMGICFVGEIPMKEFLQQKIKPTPGSIVTASGEVIGQHEGLAFYTIGQRHGFAQVGGGQPLYVVEKRAETNELVVGYEDDPLLFKKKMKVFDVNWVNGQEPTFPLQCMVRLRHRQTLKSCAVTKDENGVILVSFEEAERAVTPGQFAVFYTDELCLGGGTIC